MGGAGHVARMRRGDVHTGLWWGDLKETSLGRPGRRLEHNIKMYLPKLEWGHLDKLLWFLTS